MDFYYCVFSLQRFRNTLNLKLLIEKKKELNRTEFLMFNKMK
jgi:hypothetical protein